MIPSHSAHASPDTDLHPDNENEFHYPARSQGGLKAKRLLLDFLGRWYWIALGLILGFLGSFHYLSKAPEKYTATSTLLFKSQTEALISRDRVDEIDMRSVEGLNTVAERIRRFELMQRVAARSDVRSLPGLMPPAIDWRPEWLTGWFGGKKPDPQASKSASIPPPEPAVLASWLGSRMRVSIRAGTRLVDITFEHEVPEVAKVLADAVAREYIAELAGAVTEGRNTQTDTLLKVSEEVSAKLQAAESALANYNRALELHNSLEAQENVVSKLTRQYLAKHPRMIAANSELMGIKTRFLEEFDFAVRAPADLAYWETAIAKINAEQDNIDARLRLARQLLLARTGVLRGEINSQMSVFNALLTRIEESNVNRQGDESRVEISSFARLPGGPSSPDRNKILRTGGLGGGLFGFAIAFLLIRLDNKYNSVSQVEEDTGMPALAAVSVVNLRYLNQARHRYYRKNPDEKPDPMREIWDPHLIFRPGSSSTLYAEMFRILRASVTLLGDESKRKITLFSSALPGEGKSFVSSNFALAAAGQGRKTLLIDLDLRKPMIHRIFGVGRTTQGAGITEWLAGQTTLDDAIHREVGCENLHVLLCGQRAPNPGELLNVSNLKRLLAEACEKYDVVVLDTAPLLSVPDTRVIVPLVDNFCLVVRANYVSKGAVLRTLEILASADTPPSGIVLNYYQEKRLFIGQNYSYGSYRYNRFGRPYQYGYGYGVAGVYGSDGEDERAAQKEILKRRRKVKSGDS